nr:hypothetical protein [Tanacetum cinerariifolium]
MLKGSAAHSLGKQVNHLKKCSNQISPRVTLRRLLPHARGLGFKPRRGGFPSGAKKEWGLSPKVNHLKKCSNKISPRVTLRRLLPHARGLGFKPRRGGFPSGAKKEWGLSPKVKVRVLHTAQLDVTKFSMSQRTILVAQAAYFLDLIMKFKTSSVMKKTKLRKPKPMQKLQRNKLKMKNQFNSVIC